MKIGNPLKVTVCWLNFFPPVVRTYSPEHKNVFTKISVKGGPCNIYFVFSPILPTIAAKQCQKLDILATSLFILRTVCDLTIFLIP